MPDVFFLQLGNVECYILREGELFKAQYGATSPSRPFQTPGECLNWIIRKYNGDKNADPRQSNATVHIIDASELLDQGDPEASTN
jgi:hypothetical protein